MEELARVYARSLFEVALEQGKLDLIREQLSQFAQAIAHNRDLSVFFFSPYFSREEKKSSLQRVLKDADPSFLRFLQLLIESHRMPVIARIKDAFQTLWEQEHRVLPVEITSAVELDQETIQGVGQSIGQRTGRRVALTARVDPDILGGIVVRVGNSILDASIRNRLEQLRRHVSHAASV